MYDSFINPKDEIVNFHPAISGLTQSHWETVPANLKLDLKKVQQDVYNHIKGKIIIGYKAKEILDSLLLTIPGHLTRDILSFKKFASETDSGLVPLLTKFASASFLPKNVVGGQALAAMHLYQQVREEWEAEIRSKFPKQTKKQKKRNLDSNG